MPVIARKTDIPFIRSMQRRSALVTAIAVFIMAVSGVSLWRSYAQSGIFDEGTHRNRVTRAVAQVFLPPLPALPEQELMELSPDEAVAANAEIKPSTDPLEVARPFILPGGSANLANRYSALDCLTAAIYYEAASESEQGQRAVAQVVLNRMRHPAFPKSVCGVVFQGSERTTGCQFSFTCDGSMNRNRAEGAWDRARQVAIRALAGQVEPSVGMATHYHTIWVLPYWAPSLAKITTIGAHIFYRWQGFWGKRKAFAGNYAGERSDEALAENVLLPVVPTVAEIEALPGSAAPGPMPSPLQADHTAGQLVTPTALAHSVPSPAKTESSTENTAKSQKPKTNPLLKADDRAGTLILDETKPPPAAPAESAKHD